MEDLNKQKLITRANELTRRIKFQRLGIDCKKFFISKTPALHKIYDEQIEISENDIKKAEEELMEVNFELNRQVTLI